MENGFEWWRKEVARVEAEKSVRRVERSPIRKQSGDGRDGGKFLIPQFPVSP